MTYVCGCRASGCEETDSATIRFCSVHAAAFELLAACNAVDIYFKAMCEQWAANDGRVASESGTLIKGSAEIQNLCEVAGAKVWMALQKAIPKAKGL